LLALSPPPSIPEPFHPVREPAFNIPAATGSLIVVNIVVHAARTLLLRPDQDDAFVNMLGFNSASLAHPFSGLTILSLFTYQFLHAGWAHLAANMVFLLALGPGVERPLGRPKFILIYFLSGIVGALVESLFTPAGVGDVLIGASASGSGVFGALLVIWGFHLRGRRPIGIVRLALLMSALMAITGILGVGADGMPVAWVAHIGGFIAGIALAFVVRPRPDPLARLG